MVSHQLDATGTTLRIAVALQPGLQHGFQLNTPKGMASGQWTGCRWMRTRFDFAPEMSKERRKLSSAHTFMTKFVLPTVWLAGFVGGTVLLFTTRGFTGPAGPPPAPEMKWLFLGATVVGAVFLYWWCMRLKRVEIDEQWLYVSNYLREIRVPLKDIEEVTENRWVNIRPITVEFRRETEFGSRIVFMPQTRWWKFWQAHPVVGELEAASRRARGLPPEPAN